MNRSSQCIQDEERGRIEATRRFVAAVKQGLADVEAGRVMDDEELTRRLEARFGRTAPERAR